MYVFLNNRQKLRRRTTWGLILAIAAIVLTVRLTVFGNLITPLIRDWWARRSLVSLELRIAARQKELNRVSVIPEMTDSCSSLFAPERRGSLSHNHSNFLAITPLVPQESPSAQF